MNFSENEAKSIGYGVSLVLANILLMSLLSFTPAASLLNFLSGINGFLVIIFYGALLTIGNSLAESGIKQLNYTTAGIGVFLLQFAYGTFGAGLLQGIGIETQAIALGITAVITTLLAIIAGIIVYRSDKDFSKWRKYSLGFFIGVLVFGGIGIIFVPAFVLAFISALLGFLALLVYEIWEMKAHRNRPILNAVGLYVAYMGLFIQILQLVLRILSALEE